MHCVPLLWTLTSRFLHVLSLNRYCWVAGSINGTITVVSAVINSHFFPNACSPPLFASACALILYLLLFSYCAQRGSFVSNKTLIKSFIKGHKLLWSARGERVVAPVPVFPPWIQNSCKRKHVSLLPKISWMHFSFMCICVYDSPGNAEHHHTYDDHLECSDDGGDKDIVQFAGAWNHVEHIVFFDIALGTFETRVTAGCARAHHWGGKERKRQVNYFCLLNWNVSTCLQRHCGGTMAACRQCWVEHGW